MKVTRIDHIVLRVSMSLYLADGNGVELRAA
jgi:hypothetical protein